VAHGLKIKHYAKTGVIRSVGDPPNGVVAVSFHGGAHFIVHPKAKPVTATKPLTIQQEHGSDPEDDGAVPITVEEAIEAAVHCKRTPWVLWEAAVVALHNEAGRVSETFDVEGLEAATGFVKEVRDQLAVNGLLSRGGS